MGSDWKSNALGLIGIALSVLAFINKEERLLVGAIFAGTIIFYIIGSLSENINEQEERILKLEEKVKIHEQMVTLKGEVEFLKKEVSRK